MSQADKKALLYAAKAFGKDESWLTNGQGCDSDVRGWHGIDVNDGRVTYIGWNNEYLTGSIPKEIGNLNLAGLALRNNLLSGDIPIE